MVGEGRGHLLDGDAATVAELARVPTVPVPVPPGGGAELAACVRQLPDDVAAAFLTRVDPARARAAQRDLERAGGRQALSEEDTAAIALAAACLGHLRRVDRDPAAARVLVAGAAGMPGLGPLLMGCGVFDISLWNRADERWFPLRRAARDADVVIGLLDRPTLAVIAADRPDGSVIPHPGPAGRTPAAPGVLRALTRYPAGLVELGVDLYRDCALAIADATPDLRDPGLITGLVTAVETAVHRSITARRPRRG